MWLFYFVRSACYIFSHIYNRTSSWASRTVCRLKKKERKTPCSEWRPEYWCWWRVWSFVVFKFYGYGGYTIHFRILLFTRDQPRGKVEEATNRVLYVSNYYSRTQVFSRLNMTRIFNWIRNNFDRFSFVLVYTRSNPYFLVRHWVRKNYNYSFADYVRKRNCLLYARARLGRYEIVSYY